MKKDKMLSEVNNALRTEFLRMFNYARKMHEAEVKQANAIQNGLCLN